jgi:hypothetical protein
VRSHGGAANSSAWTAGRSSVRDNASAAGHVHDGDAIDEHQAAILGRPGVWEPR